MSKPILILFFILIFFINAYAARYISLAPSTTEILFALGLDEEIVGVSSYCNYPQEAFKKPKVGNFSEPSLEKIISLKPDYIFCTGLEQAPIIGQLKRLGFNVYVSDPSNLDELLQSILEIGSITSREKQSLRLVSDMQQSISRIQDKVRSIPQNKRIKVFIEVWHDPLTTAGNGSYIDAVLNLAGGINIAHDTKRAYSIFSSEEVIKRDPECIILAYMDKEAPLKLVKDRFGWNQITAVKNDKVFNDINPDILLRPGPRIAVGINEIYKKLYSNEK